MKSISRFGLGALCLGVLAVAGWGEDPPATQEGITLKTCGLSVSGPAYGEGNDALHPGHSFDSGTSVTLLAKAGNGCLIEFLESESEVKKFADDKGTDLLAGKMEFGRPGFAMGPQISKDGHAAMIDLRGGSCPSADASRIVIEGTAVFLLSPSGKTESSKAESAELKQGGKISVGKETLTISKAGKPEWGDDPMAVEFSSDKLNLHCINSVKFLDADGKEIPSSRNSISSSTMGSSVTYAMEYLLKKKVEKATIVFEYWPDVKKVSVPVSLKVGVGL